MKRQPILEFGVLLFVRSKQDARRARNRGLAGAMKGGTHKKQRGDWTNEKTDLLLYPEHHAHVEEQINFY